MDSIPQKRCSKCKECKDRTSENFGPDKRTLDRFRSVCKPCRHVENEEALKRNPNMHKERYQKRRQDSDEIERQRVAQATAMRKFREKKREAGLCPQCGINPCEPGSHCADCQAKHLKYKGKYRHLYSKYGKTERDKIRQQVLEAYGGKCTCCGESTPEFLAIDHINEDGATHRRAINKSNIYRWLRQQDFPKDDFQLLCHNCNFAKSHYEGGCPHQRNY